MRGFGRSSYKKRIISIQDFVEDLHLFYAEIGISRAILVGLSLGAAVAI